MSIETEFFTTLSGNGGVSALVASRIYPNRAPNDTALPYIVTALITTDRLSTITGVGDPARKQMQAECHATSYSSAKAVAAAVIAALEGDGYQELEYDLYDDSTERHTVIVGWSYITD